jgi:hypothetical protein
MVVIEHETGREAYLARLTTAAYEAALRHGIRGSFADLELSLWRALRAAVQDETDRAAKKTCPQ